VSASRPRRSKQHRREARKSKYPKCPTPSKLAFTSQEHAESALRYFGYQHRSVRPVRAYLCGCGSWHLTSKEQR
jgi:hypothetical protein